VQDDIKDADAANGTEKTARDLVKSERR